MRIPRATTAMEIIQADHERGLQAMKLAADQIGPAPEAGDHWVEHERYAARRSEIAEAIMRRLN